MNEAWIAERMRHIEASGIRKAFDLSKRMKDPINLSIGLPDFDVPESIKARRSRRSVNPRRTATRSRWACPS